MNQNADFVEDEIYGERLLISTRADQYIARRKADFVNGLIDACYVVFNGEAVVVNAKEQTRREIESTINELKP